MIQDPEPESRRWNTLQEPARASQTPAAYLLMLSALDNGWRIEEPVSIHFSSSGRAGLAYQVRLIREMEGGGFYQLLIHNCPEMETFLQAERIQVTIGLDGSSQPHNTKRLQ